MDTHHKQLVELLNQLHLAMIEGRGQETILSTLQELVRYCNMHFAAEERLMRAHSYPGLEAHTAVHRDLARQVEQFVQDFRAGKTMLSIKLMRFLQNWLVDHIQGEDRRFAHFYHNR